MHLENTIGFEIKKQYAKLRPSEQRAADFILSHMEQVSGMSLAKLAHQSGVSQPTVLRCIRGIGYEGYKDFQYAVVSEQARNEEELHALHGYKLCREDTMESVPSKVVVTTIEMLEHTLKCISAKELAQVVRYLTEAKRITIFGVENSMTITKDLSTKLLYLGLDCHCYEDYYMQRIQAGNLTKYDVAIGVSYSGCSKDTVDVMKIARRSGARTVVITNFKDSLISTYGDVVLYSSHEQLLYGNAIFSRTAQLAVVDMIYMGVILSNYEHFAKNLDRSSRLIQDKAYGTIK